MLFGKASAPATSVVGFTGTQAGMSARQLRGLRRVLTQLGAKEFHHGDCIGSDEEAHDVADVMGLRLVIHPPDNDSKRAFCRGAIRTYPPRPYLKRNQDIVNSSQVLVAAPKSGEEELRSGTWATIRYARKLGRRVIILER